MTITIETCVTKTDDRSLTIEWERSKAFPPRVYIATDRKRKNCLVVSGEPHLRQLRDAIDEALKFTPPRGLGPDGHELGLHPDGTRA